VAERGAQGVGRPGQASVEGSQGDGTCLVNTPPAGRPCRPLNRFAGRGGSNGGDGASAEEEQRWRRWVDERFVRVLTANIYRSWE
jgi:hypothetical protein